MDVGPQAAAQAAKAERRARNEAGQLNKTGWSWLHGQTRSISVLACVVIL